MAGLFATMRVIQAPILSNTFYMAPLRIVQLLCGDHQEGEKEKQGERGGSMRKQRKKGKNKESKECWWHPRTCGTLEGDVVDGSCFFACDEHAYQAINDIQGMFMYL